MSKFLAIFEFLSGILGYFERKELKDAGKNELKIEELKKENDILIRQKENSINSKSDADSFWLREDAKRDGK